jgi:hypothetical protein
MSVQRSMIITLVVKSVLINLETEALLKVVWIRGAQKAETK